MADIENSMSSLFFKRALTMVDFPDPDGAENIINLPDVIGYVVKVLHGSMAKVLYGYIVSPLGD